MRRNNPGEIALPLVHRNQSFTVRIWYGLKKAALGNPSGFKSMAL